MEINNQTQFHAALFRTAMNEEQFAASVFVRITYDMVDGRLVVSEEQSWKVSAGPWECDYGAMPGDELFYNGGVDLLIFGHAQAPQGHAVGQLELTVEVGSEFRRQVMAFGERRWVRQGNTLVPSHPDPFNSMPLSLAHAYGGKDQWDGLNVPYPKNPDGKGYYMEEKNAEGQPLPNLEEPQALVTNWNDHPEPVGFGACPPYSSVRMERGFDVDENGNLRELRPTFFNAAYPGMIIPSVEVGDWVSLRGFSSSGPLEFAIPPNDLFVRLTFGDEVVDKRPSINQLGVEVDSQRVFISYRYPFRYRMVPLQKRSCELHAEQSITALGRSSL